MTSYGDSPHGSDWSSASNVGRKEDRPQLEAYPKEKPALSRLNQQVLSVRNFLPAVVVYSSLTWTLQEDEYTQAVSDIIKRTFFPQLRELDARNDLIQAYQSEDPQAIEDSVRRMRELVTPTPRRRARGASLPPFPNLASTPHSRPTAQQAQLPATPPSAPNPPTLLPTSPKPPPRHARLPVTPPPQAARPSATTPTSPSMPSRKPTPPRTTHPSPNSSPRTTPSDEPSTVGRGRRSARRTSRLSGGGRRARGWWMLRGEWWRGIPKGL